MRQIRNINDADRNERIKNHEAKLHEYEKKIESITLRVSFDTSTCPICLETVTKPRAITNCCKNVFCFECILMALSATQKCPLCKVHTTGKSLHIESDIHVDKKSKVSNEPLLLSKTNTLFGILKHMTPESRYLIFSEYDSSFNRIAYKLNQKGICYEVLKGRMESQQKSIQNFENGHTQILMLNANNFGAGLNLQMTTDIIIYHKFRNNELRKQVIGRAQRPGRTSQLTVTYLTHEGEGV